MHLKRKKKQILPLIYWSKDTTKDNKGGELISIIDHTPVAPIVAEINFMTTVAKLKLV